MMGHTGITKELTWALDDILFFINLKEHEIIDCNNVKNYYYKHIFYKQLI